MISALRSADRILLAAQMAKIAEKYGFADIKHALFHRTRIFSASEYCALLGTYSDHIAIKETIIVPGYV